MKMSVCFSGRDAVIVRSVWHSIWQHATSWHAV